MTHAAHRGAVALSGVIAAVLAASGLAGCSAGDGGITTSGPADLGSPATSAAPAVAGDGAAGITTAPDDGAAAGGTESATPTHGTSSAAAARPATTVTRAPARPATGTRTSAAKTGAAARSAATTSTPAIPPMVLLLGPGTEDTAEAEAVRLVNLEREEHGCGDVAVDPTLVQLARAHSQDMAGAAGFRHNGSDGRTPFQRMTAAGFTYAIAAENIAAGPPTAPEVMTAWMQSDAYRANILDCRFTLIGVGRATREGSEFGTYWTQEFAAPLTG